VLVPPPVHLPAAATAEFVHTGVIAHVTRRTVHWADTRSGEDRRGLPLLTVRQCRHATIYVLGPLSNVVVSDCRKVTLVVGAVAGIVRLTRCTGVTLVAAARRVVLGAAEQCVLHVHTPNRPLILDGVYSLTLAPFHAEYPALGSHLAAAGLTPALSDAWMRPAPVSSRGA
jgi:hypothetical protein